MFVLWKVPEIICLTESLRCQPLREYFTLVTCFSRLSYSWKCRSLFLCIEKLVLFITLNVNSKHGSEWEPQTVRRSWGQRRKEWEAQCPLHGGCALRGLLSSWCSEQGKAMSPSVFQSTGRGVRTVVQLLKSGTSSQQRKDGEVDRAGSSSRPPPQPARPPPHTPSHWLSACPQPP